QLFSFPGKEFLESKISGLGLGRRFMFPKKVRGCGSIDLGQNYETYYSLKNALRFTDVDLANASQVYWLRCTCSDCERFSRYDSELIHSMDSRIRARGLAPLTTAPSPDLFFYVFLDFAVDAYYPILDEVEERLEDLDKQAITTFKTRVRRMENVVSIVTTIGG